MTSLHPTYKCRRLINYRVKDVIERHSDVERYRGSVWSGRKRTAIVLVQYRSLDPVLVRVVIGRVALIAATIFRPHSQVTASTVALGVNAFPPYPSGARRWREPDVIADVIADVVPCDVIRAVDSAVGRSRNVDIAVWQQHQQTAQSHREGKHLHR